MYHTVHKIMQHEMFLITRDAALSRAGVQMINLILFILPVIDNFGKNVNLVKSKHNNCCKVPFIPTIDTMHKVNLEINDN